MDKFTTVTGIAASFPKENIDTDAIIPAPLTRTASRALGHALFARWRYDDKGNEIADFTLNKDPFRHSQIIVAGPNFGCGSSRETAVWALTGFGIRVVIAPSFGDIFFENCFKNGLLPVALPEGDVRWLLDFLAKANDPTLTVDLNKCVIVTAARTIPFTVARARRTALMEGLDEIGQTLACGAEISAFYERDRSARPWVYDSVRQR